MSRVVVTGGAGFIGSHVVDAFLAADYEVLVLDDLSTGSRRNIADDASFERLDVAFGNAVELAVARFEPTVVCHLAAQASVTVSVQVPKVDLHTNVLGTLKVLQAAAQVEAPVVFASSGGALYGDRAPIPTSESEVCEPLAPYGASKLAAEAYVGSWGRRYGLPNVSLRLGNVYGPRQRSDGEAGVVSIFSARLRAGVPPVVYGEGTPTRDYVHVRDVARAFLLAAETTYPAVYNVGTGIETTTLQILDGLQREAGTSLEPEFAPLRPGELRRSALDISQIRLDGWEPLVELADGLIETFRDLE